MAQSKTSLRSSLKRGKGEKQEFALGKYNPSTGALWRAKKDLKKTKGSHTPGSSKNDNCKAKPLERHFAKASRAYKHRDYASWMKKTDLDKYRWK